MPKSWDNANYGKRREIAVQATNIDANLTFFPLLLKLTDTETIANADIASKRYEIYDHNGNELAYEETAYSEGASYANADIWVSVSGWVLYASPTGEQNKVWLYYDYDPGSDQDDASNVWDSSHVGVWHLNDDDSDEWVTDSTSNAHTAEKQDPTHPTQVAGLIGNCQRFTGVILAPTDYIVFPDMTGHFGSEASTLSLFLKIDTDPPANVAQSGIMDFGTSTSASHYPYTEGTIYLGELRNDRIAVGAGLIADLTAWHHLAITNITGADNWIVYQNGAVADTDSGETSLYVPTAPVLGRSEGNTRYLDGDACELRLSSAVRAPAWLNFEQANVLEADNEQTWGAEETPAAAFAFFPYHVRSNTKFYNSLIGR